MRWNRKFNLLALFRKSIQAKVFAAFGLLMLVALLLVGLVIYIHLTDNIKKNATVYVTDSIRRADENVNAVLKDANHLLALVVTNQENVIDVLRSDNYEISLEWFKEQKQINSFLSYLTAYKSQISRIAVVGTNGKIFSVGVPYLDRTTLNEELVQQIIQAPEQKTFIKQYHNGREETLTIARTIRYNREPIGVVMIDLDYQIIQSNYDIRPSDDSFVYILGDNGDIVYSSAAAKSMEPADSPTDMAAQLNKFVGTSQVREEAIGGEKQLVVSSTSDFTGWTTVGIIPEHTLLKDSLALRNQIINLVLLVYMAVLAVSAAVSSHITKNLRRLRNTMERVQEDSFIAATHITAEDEVGQLSLVFQNMLRRLRESMNEIKQRERLKREAELTALQAQIRPHFLYNSLNTIKYMASLNHASNIEEVSSSLIELLRGVLGNTKEFIPLREELHYVQSYINIQKYKYIDRFSVHYQISPELLDTPVLKLILQPLVENAVTHGVGVIKEKGIITVKAYVENGLLKLEVADNGGGMTAEQIRLLLEEDADAARTKPFRSGGMGICNVNERIRMVYGPEYGLQIFSRPGAFTRVEITIPVNRGDVSHV
ncbi:sensor histidine kinase [Paenibacillus doosanensis]|uniref:histidine kinase n=1 Tax=Paenibacillus konkukensis TaxID=2020716 RepID=A0ABY4RG53_9BACL|nr:MULTISPECIES: sensor histidine kinase [Paenibacillus]MCS7463865.1 sensor histidine kinase [Paenibacillus doosanensis]UQZ81173.1 putative sensor-like histidine kinase [Paenibacillus konkukensis]